ncbi:MAG: hypothetical protein PHX61_13625 [Alphaproteobacteria bacterium]|nr:hypothetical protein [Alphaproteobacteria bacterium]
MDFDSRYRPRLQVDVSEEQMNALNRYLDRGARKMVFNILIDDLLELIEKHGAGPVIGLLIERHITLRDVCRLKLTEPTKGG